jgi:hypothetical protein
MNPHELFCLGETRDRNYNFYSMLDAPDPIEGSIPLTTAEKTRLLQLESTVQTHLESFLTVGRSLCEIRDKRLFREFYGTWEIYCERKWGIGYARANDIARCAQIADNLLEGCAAPEGGDAPLPDDLSPDALRPLRKLTPELQQSCWRLASRITEKPTGNIVSRIVRVVQEAINQGGDENGAGRPKSKPPQSHRKLFLLSVHRLAANPYFSAHLVVAGLSEAEAGKHKRACNALISRCHEVLEEITQLFPEL